VSQQKHARAPRKFERIVDPRHKACPMAESSAAGQSFSGIDTSASMSCVKRGLPSSEAASPPMTMPGIRAARSHSPSAARAGPNTCGSASGTVERSDPRPALSDAEITRRRGVLPSLAAGRQRNQLGIFLLERHARKLAPLGRRDLRPPR
jgi:hypothetical protein